MAWATRGVFMEMVELELGLGGRVRAEVKGGILQEDINNKDTEMDVGIKTAIA